MNEGNKYDRFEELVLVAKNGSQYLIYERDVSRGLERKSRLLIHGDDERIPFNLRNKVEPITQTVKPIDYKPKIGVELK